MKFPDKRTIRAIVTNQTLANHVGLHERTVRRWLQDQRQFHNIETVQELLDLIDYLADRKNK